MNKKFLKKATPYLFLAPFFIIFSIFMIYPIFNSLYLSFTSAQGIVQTWVGFENYINILTDKVFWKSLLNVFIVLIVQVPLMLFLGTILSSFLNSEKLKFKGFFRLLIFLPVLIDLVTYSIVFSILFQEQYGIVNYVLNLMHLPSIMWLSNPIWARILIMIAVTWRWTGYNTVIILAGLQSIDNSLYEAADIDGAGPVTKLVKITLPLLTPVLLFCAIMSTIGTVQLFTEPQLLTVGGPNNSTLTPIMYLYQYGFQNFKFGYASAVAYVITFIVFVMSLIQIKLSKGAE